MQLDIGDIDACDLLMLKELLDQIPGRWFPTINSGGIASCDPSGAFNRKEYLAYGGYLIGESMDPKTVQLICWMKIICPILIDQVIKDHPELSR